MMGISVLLMQRKASLALDYRAAMPYVDALMSGGSGGLGILVGRGMRGQAKRCGGDFSSAQWEWY
jgi:hypothetical protein